MSLWVIDNSCCHLCCIISPAFWEILWASRRFLNSISICRSGDKASFIHATLTLRSKLVIVLSFLMRWTSMIKWVTFPILLNGCVKSSIWRWGTVITRFFTKDVIKYIVDFIDFVLAELLIHCVLVINGRPYKYSCGYS